MARQEVEAIDHEGDLDDIDALFADKSLDELLANQEAEDAKADAGRRPRKRDDDSINVDDEIRITKKRQPIAKLDDERLLSANGIPRLRKVAKKTRFQGKGHEFTDVAMLLRTYQIWLDDLYPRAKFADGLSLVEKVGHTKRMQMQRRAWINETRHGSDPIPENDMQDLRQASGDLREMDVNTMSGALQPESLSDDLDDILSADTIDRDNAADLGGPVGGTISPSHRGLARNEAEPDLDELDQLLADEAQANEDTSTSIFGRRPATSEHDARVPDRGGHEDDEDALREMEMDIPW